MNRKDELYKAACERIRELKSQLAEARADVLREVYDSGKLCYDCSGEILALIDQPQEDVCEWEFLGEGWHQAGCMHGGVEDWSYNEDWKFCPYCGRPIKIKE